MNIGLIIPASMIISGSTSGIIRQALAYQDALIKQGHRCSFVNYQDGIYSYEFLLIFRHNPEIKLLIERARTKNRKIKIIFMPIFDPFRMPSLIRKIIYRIPTEKLQLFSNPRLMRIACDQSELVWVRSKWELKALKSTGTKTPIKLVPLAIPILIDENICKIKKDIDFIFVGHLDDSRKNIMRLIQAVSKISNNLNIVGKSSDEQLKKVINASQKLNLKITYHGVISDYSLAKLYARSRVLCLPSLMEGVGLVALEASCYGANIAITSIGGTTDYFNQKAYYINNPKNINQITKVLKKAHYESRDYSIINKKIINKYSPMKIGSILDKELKTLNS